MRFQIFGSREHPVVLMLPGSFCPGSSMAYLYGKLRTQFYVIVPDYNGHDKNSTFSSRRGEAAEIVDFLTARHITEVAMVYGQSMGAEVAVEVIRQLRREDIAVGSGFFDDAPCIRLPVPYRAFMYVKFLTLIHMLRKKSVDEVMRWEFLRKFTNGDTQSLRPLLEPVAGLAPYLTKQSIKNETECCYTFDFPALDPGMQKRMYFFYAKEEKAYKTCIGGVKKAYPHAHFQIVGGYGHLTYSVKNTDDYLDMLTKIAGKDWQGGRHK